MDIHPIVGNRKTKALTLQVVHIDSRERNDYPASFILRNVPCRQGYHLSASNAKEKTTGDNKK